MEESSLFLFGENIFSIIKQNEVDILSLMRVWLTHTAVWFISKLFIWKCKNILKVKHISSPKEIVLWAFFCFWSKRRLHVWPSLVKIANGMQKMWNLQHSRNIVFNHCYVSGYAWESVNKQARKNGTN